MKKGASRLSKALLILGRESTSTRFSSVLSMAMYYSKLILYLPCGAAFHSLTFIQSLFLYLSRYYVEFSKPDKLRPIPEGTVKVFFDITMGDSADDYDIEFNFENESLKHRMDSTMREDMFQVSRKNTTLTHSRNISLKLSD